MQSDSRPFQDLLGRVAAAAREDYSLRWEGSFSDYLEIVRQNPGVARLAHARLYDMVRSHGVREGRDGPEYAFFDGQLFGMEPVLRRLMEYLGAAAARADAHRRVLLLVGPVGTAKSHLVMMLKRGLEAYSRTDEGALYGIVGCPLHEEPLHLIPDEVRPDVERELGVRIEGQLCPRCQNRLDQAEGDLSGFRVERLILAEHRRLGIATYAAGEEKTQSLSDLVGKTDLAKLAQIGREDDPEVFDFGGELDRASRGLFEGIELLKWVPELLYTLITVSQERQIKAPDFPVTYLDTVLVAHTNAAEYQRYIADARNEAIRSRLYMIRVPYVLRVQDEIRIYERLVAEAQLTQHLAPGTLRLLAQYAVYSRLYDPHDRTVSRWDKLRLYDGEPLQDVAPHRVDDLRQEFPEEGMTGLSPRDSLNVLTQALGATAVPCVTPIDVLRTIRSFIQERKFLAVQRPEEWQQLYDALGVVRQEYDRTVRETVMEAFVHAFDTVAQTMFTRYLDEAEAAIRKTRVRDPVTGEPREPDLQFLKQIEDQIGLGEASVRGFREELLVAVGAAARQGQPIRWNDHLRLANGIKQRLFQDVRNLVRTTTATRTPDPEQARKLAEVKEALAERGYCTHCAETLLAYAGTLLAHD
jgi:serine protein kinase